MAISSNGLPGRNELCPCKSGLRVKFCHGDEIKRQICNQVAREKMMELIVEERKKRGLQKCRYACCLCGATFEMAVESTMAANVYLCPECGDTRITDNENKEIQEKNNGD